MDISLAQGGNGKTLDILVYFSSVLARWFTQRNFAMKVGCVIRTQFYMNWTRSVVGSVISCRLLPFHGLSLDLSGFCHVRRHFWLFLVVFFSIRMKQECIPVECVPTAAVAASRGVCPNPSPFQVCF